ncbi:MAG: threonine aldolase family protein, partial [Acidobacteria bacterium]|nr:threonine aldolase family protein [Acidobacteriota bacterium]MDW7985329.1 threonine aldolase family protein [Acidobacteriota bacterium]
MRVVDLRSDTVTQPTPEMRRAMSLAEVGDDVFGEDPTVRRLEERAADRLGKEAALFLPSGTMGNQVALKAWTRPGQEVILDARAHIVLYEMAAMAVISGLLPNPIPTEAGHFGAADVAARVRPPVSYVAPTGLVSVENTHNMAGGTIFPQEQLAEVYVFCRSRGLPVHMDGARIFNAAVAQGIPVRAIAQYADS